MASPTTSPKRPPEVYTRAEVLALLRACSTRGSSGIRNRALISLIYRTGIRIGEALDLLPKDLDLEAGTVTVLHGKGDRHRTVGIDADALDSVLRWLDRRRDLGINGRSPIFCTLRGGRLADSYVRELLPRLARKAGIEKRLHAHGLRHSFAYGLAEENVPVPEISLALGHRDLGTTWRYIRHVAPIQVIRRMRDRSGWMEGTNP